MISASIVKKNHNNSMLTNDVFWLQVIEGLWLGMLEFGSDTAAEKAQKVKTAQKMGKWGQFKSSSSTL